MLVCVSIEQTKILSVASFLTILCIFPMYCSVSFEWPASPLKGSPGAYLAVPVVRHTHGLLVSALGTCVALAASCMVLGQGWKSLFLFSVL